MTIGEMWRANAVSLLLLIVINLALFALGMTPWMVLGLICLAGGLFLSFRRGMGFGHEACAILSTVWRAEDPQSPTHGQLDPKIIRRAWSRSTGIRGMLASALIPYVAGCAYIAAMLLGIQPLILPMRLLSWVLALPFWPTVILWNETFDRLTPTIIAVLMISPFVLPLCAFAGYLQGPKLWAKSEKAMAEGKRRAKAKSRVVRKKRIPRSQRPEI